MRRTFAFLISGLAIAFAATAVSSAAEPTADTKATSHLQDALDKRFTDSMNGVTMIGHSASGSLKDGKSLPEERYGIESVTKMEGDKWLFKARLQVEGQDLTLPIPLKVLWAGDTPVITLEDVSIPGFGTFSAHVLITGHTYAGTWSHGEGGGEIFGRIEKTEAKK